MRRWERTWEAAAGEVMGVGFGEGEKKDVGKRKIAVWMEPLMASLTLMMFCD